MNNMKDSAENIYVEKEKTPGDVQNFKPGKQYIIQTILSIFGAVAALSTVSWAIYTLIENLNIQLLRFLATLLICLMFILGVFFVIERRAFQNAKTAYENLQSKYKELEIRFNDLENQDRALRQEIIEVSSVKTKVSSLEREREELLSKLEEKERELKNLKDVYQNKIEKTMQKVKELELEKQNLKDTVEELQEKLNAEKEKVRELNGQIEQYKKIFEDSKIKPVIDLEYNVENTGALWWSEKNHYIIIKNKGYGDAFSVTLNIILDGKIRKKIPIAEILKKGEGKKVFLGTNKSLEKTRYFWAYITYKDLYGKEYESRHVKYAIKK